MSNWTEGYVADITYTQGYYRELSPASLSLALMLRGLRAPDLSQSLTYCELGFGYGLSLLVHAACFPNIRFYGTDFNPAHAAHAHQIAQQAGLDNVTVFDDSFEQLALRDLPQMDFIVLHGIYSWVSPDIRRGIVEFIDRRLKPGGVVYVSYNALPGWSAAMPMRELMRLHSTRESSPALPTTTKVKQAVEFMGDLNGRKLRYFMSVPGMEERIKRLHTANANYLAHEYFNREWHPQYFYQVAEEMAAARIEFACSAQLSDHIDAANLTREALQHLRSIPDLVMRETLRDYYLNQQFRRDIYTRGASKLPQIAQFDQMLDQRWALIAAREIVNFSIQVGPGEVSLDPAAHQPIIDALAEGPLSGRDLLQRKDVGELGHTRLMQALILLAQAGYLHALQPNEQVEAARASCLRFNNVIAGQAADGEINYVACPLSGLAVNRSRVALMQTAAYLAGTHDAAAMAEKVWSALATRNQKMVRDGIMLETRDENLAYLQELSREFVEYEVPRLKVLGLL